MPTEGEEIWRVVASTFCAGAIVHAGRVVEAAPILGRVVRHRSTRELASIAAARGWLLDYRGVPLRHLVVGAFGYRAGATPPAGVGAGGTH